MVAGLGIKAPPSTLPLPVNRRQAPGSENWPDSFLASATGSAPPRPSLHLPRLKEEEVEEVVEEEKGPNTSTNRCEPVQTAWFFEMLWAALLASRGGMLLDTALGAPTFSG